MPVKDTTKSSVNLLTSIWTTVWSMFLFFLTWTIGIIISPLVVFVWLPIVSLIFQIRRYAIRSEINSSLANQGQAVVACALEYFVGIELTGNLATVASLKGWDDTQKKYLVAAVRALIPHHNEFFYEVLAAEIERSFTGSATLDVIKSLSADKIPIDYSACRLAIRHLATLEGRAELIGKVESQIQYLKRKWESHITGYDQLEQMPGVHFEEIVAMIFERRGYTIQTTPTTGDFSVDLIARRGDEVIAIQCKRYGDESSVGNKDVLALKGGQAYYKAKSAVIITTSRLTPMGIQACRAVGVEYWEGPQVQAAIKDAGLFEASRQSLKELENLSSTLTYLRNAHLGSELELRRFAETAATFEASMKKRDSKAG